MAHPRPFARGCASEVGPFYQTPEKLLMVILEA
jgi:hypothetical protein